MTEKNNSALKSFVWLIGVMLKDLPEIASELETQYDQTNFENAIIKIETAQKILLEFTQEKKTIQPFSTDNLKLSTRAKNILRLRCYWKFDRLDYDEVTLDHLRQITAEELLEIRNCGQMSLMEIQHALLKYGVEIK